jgi:membrane protease YdiL (CAAX protease family)
MVREDDPMTRNDPTTSRTAAPLSRPLSALEFAIGAAIVIGHNVFKVIPNEVPILFVLALVSTRVREGGWAALGFRRPESWRRVAVLVVVAVVLCWAESAAIEPLTSRFWPPIVAPKLANRIVGNPIGALEGLGIVWTFAAFGEEIGYRGYLMKRFADMGGGGRWSWIAACVVQAVLFGFGHYYKGPAGVLDSGLVGLIIGAAFLLSGRCLWTAILIHGVSDTLAVALTYFGLNN